MIRLAAVVLAAGLSRRMGRDKPSLVWRGKTLLERALDAASALDIVALVGGGGSSLGATSPVGIILVPAPGGTPGQAASLAAGIAALPPDVTGAAILLADMPLVTAGLVRLLAKAFTPGRYLVPCYQGRPGNPVIIPGEEFPRIMELAGDTGARALYRRPDAPVDWLHTDDPAVAMDVDTPDDLARLEALAARQAHPDTR
jgi:molybdenum cofactor cytidylyltransferase